MTSSECEAFVRQIGGDLRGLASDEKSDVLASQSILVFLESERHRSFFLAKQFTSILGTYESCLLWVKEFGIWPSSENRHLYYRLRRSYGDERNLTDAPGHWFAAHEQEDVATFLDLAFQFGWGVVLIPIPVSIQVFVSHDGWARITNMSPDLDIAKTVHEWEVSYKIETGVQLPPAMQ